MGIGWTSADTSRECCSFSFSFTQEIEYCFCYVHIETVFVPVHRLAVLTDWRFPSSFSDPALLPGYLSGLMVRASDKSFCSDPSWIPEFFPHRFISRNNILIHDVMISHTSYEYPINFFSTACRYPLNSLPLPSSPFLKVHGLGCRTLLRPWVWGQGGSKSPY